MVTAHHKSFDIVSVAGVAAAAAAAAAAAVVVVLEAITRGIRGEFSAMQTEPTKGFDRQCDMSLVANGDSLRLGVGLLGTNIGCKILAITMVKHNHYCWAVGQISRSRERIGLFLVIILK